MLLILWLRFTTASFRFSWFPLKNLEQKVSYFNKFGFLVDSPKKWCEAIKKLLLDKKFYKIYSSNALNFAKNYDEEKVLTPVFNKIFSD